MAEQLTLSEKYGYEETTQGIKYTAQRLDQIMEFGNEDKFVNVISNYNVSNVPKQFSNMNAYTSGDVYVRKNDQGQWEERAYGNVGPVGTDNQVIMPIYFHGDFDRGIAGLSGNNSEETYPLMQTFSSDTASAQWIEEAAGRCVNALGDISLLDADFDKTILYVNTYCFDTNTRTYKWVPASQSLLGDVSRYIVLSVFVTPYYGEAGERVTNNRIGYALFEEYSQMQEGYPGDEGINKFTPSFVGNSICDALPIKKEGYAGGFPTAWSINYFTYHLPVAVYNTYYDAAKNYQTKTGDLYIDRNVHTVDLLEDNPPLPSNISNNYKMYSWRDQFGETLIQDTSSDHDVHEFFSSSFVNMSNMATKSGYPYIAMSKAQIIARINSLAAYWCDDLDHIQAELGSNCTDDHIHLPIVGPSGVTGKDYRGKDIAKSPLADSTNPYKDTPSKYKPTDRNKYTSVISLNKPALSPLSAFNTAYAVSWNQLRQLADWIWNIDDLKWQDIIDNCKMFNNPMDAIVSCRLYPFDLTRVSEGVGTQQNIMFGRSEIGVKGTQLLPNWNAMIYMGSCKYQDLFDSFVSYAHCEAYLYLPYIGTIEITPADYIGKTIDLYYIVDLMTGACSAIVSADSIPVTYADGRIGIDVPISSTDKLSYLAEKTNKEIGMATQIIQGATSVIGDVIGIASGDASKVGNLVSDIAGTSGESMQRGIDLAMTRANITKGNASTPVCSNWQPQKPYIFMEYPIVANPENYGHTVGYMLNEEHRLGDLKGFTICTNVKIEGIDCTLEEKNDIIRLLNAGVNIK